LVSIFNIIEDFYKPILKNLHDDYNTRINDFAVIKSLCVENNNLETFLSNLALDPPKDNIKRNEPGEFQDDCITISTIHSAKGLEWNTVFICAALDGLLPDKRSFTNYEDLEEERRLFYVACSRAKENLFITCPHYLNTHASYFDKESRFIAEIDKNKYLYYCETEEAKLT
jgi:DNA helicase-2/ATP-dependent DNA helicase PcrA